MDVKIGDMPTHHVEGIDFIIEGKTEERDKAGWVVAPERTQIFQVMDDEIFLDVTDAIKYKRPLKCICIGDKADNEKKSYSTPRLSVFGTISQITESASMGPVADGGMGQLSMAS